MEPPYGSRTFPYERWGLRMRRMTMLTTTMIAAAMAAAVVIALVVGGDIGRVMLSGS